MTNGAAAGASAAAAIANAVKASGVLVRLDQTDFITILSRVKDPLIVYAQQKFLKITHQYMVSHKGFVFYTKVHEELLLPAGAEVVRANKIWIPG